jgi:hypothetical protein
MRHCVDLLLCHIDLPCLPDRDCWLWRQLEFVQRFQVVKHQAVGSIQ